MSTNSRQIVHSLPRPARARDIRRDHFSAAREAYPTKTYPWWQVMCLSGVDYFSTLGYQPGIAVLAAGALAPVATAILVAVTLLGVVPVYRAVAARSPHGLGSISLAEKLLGGWKGKAAVLVLLGFAMTDFIITITLSAADAAAHLAGGSGSPWQLGLTLAALAALAAVFYRGFREAVAVAVVLVVAYLGLTVVVLAASAGQILAHGELVAAWGSAVAHAGGGHPWAIAGLALLAFPKLALGLSGFEAGVSVMPLIASTTVEARVRATQRLLVVSAVMMSALLAASSLAVAILVPAPELAPGGAANGRALAWLATSELGPVFGHVYGWATVAILWFAGASALSGLLALIPRYLPRYGMAPEWAKRSRPMVGVLALIAVVVTCIFRADVGRQAGAYATGVLVVLSAGAVAVAVLARGRQRAAGAATSAVLVATLLVNVVERPDGLRVAACFIGLVVAGSLASRCWRAFELREVNVSADDAAMRIIAAHAFGPALALVPAAHRVDLAGKELRIRQGNGLGDAPIVFLEINLCDPSQFEESLCIRGGSTSDGAPVLHVASSSIPNAVAVVSLKVHELTGTPPDVYYEWSPGNPLKEMARFIFLGDGQNATVTREMLRRAIPDEAARPRIHLC